MRYFIELSYKGTNYHGWQIQPEVNTVQEEMTKAFETILQEKIQIVGAGRTDAGVHASQMFAHVDTLKALTHEHIHKLNTVLPNDIVIKSIKEVLEKKHARFDAISRSYEYRILIGRDPFLLETTWQIHQKKIQLEKMNEAAEILFQYQDFESFSKVKTDVKTFNCTIMEAVWKLEGNQLIFYIKANRFLRNMVRAIVGTLLDVGLEKKSVDDFRNIIESKKRSEAGLSVPAKGLFLTEVTY
ncbi:tRNA pseudouridine(38-40) synthase TruA [Flavobacteriaceae bacterium]|nr:tRNA pseudouridine(38-40) synthase TruA [Flavobacteriaceae bacterium]MDB4496103.1 tRNA pseudouridine(38-40) synthase TruA [Flavobacteriaceae bacterium]MDC1168436.1 tRNA pseudouridine(38-40) synthase TruA [Flavobacteriaceae bacterium]